MVKKTQSTMAHEFQHLIHANCRFNHWKTEASSFYTETWIDEGLAMFAQELALTGNLFQQDSTTYEFASDYNYEKNKE